MAQESQQTALKYVPGAGWVPENNGIGNGVGLDASIGVGAGDIVVLGLGALLVMWIAKWGPFKKRG